MIDFSHLYDEHIDNLFAFGSKFTTDREMIKDCIQETLKPLGVMVVVEAKHMCMQMRGIEKQNSITTTSDFSGAFNQAKTRQEFMNLIHNNQI